MNTCATCKHFGPAVTEWSEDEFNDVPTRFHVCQWIEHNKDAVAHWPKAAYVKDGSGYMAALCVRDDFGCIDWESAP